MKKCPNCKREIESHSTFCEYCGHKLRNPRSVAQTIAIAALSLSLVLLVILLFVNKNQSSNMREELQTQYEQRLAEQSRAQQNQIDRLEKELEEQKETMRQQQAQYEQRLVEQETRWQQAQQGYTSTTNATVKYVVINANELRLRYGPSLDSQTLRWTDGSERYATRGEIFKYLGETDEFYKVDYHGNKLWVFKKFASLFESPE